MLLFRSAIYVYFKNESRTYYEQIYIKCIYECFKYSKIPQYV